MAVFTGNLTNEGERVVLRNSTGVIKDDLTYGEGFPWPLRRRHSAPTHSPQPRQQHRRPLAFQRRQPHPQSAKCHLRHQRPHYQRSSPRPLAPTSADTVTITARIADPDGVISVTLQLQLVEPGSYIPLTDPLYATSWMDVPMEPSRGWCLDGRSSPLLPNPPPPRPLSPCGRGWVSGGRYRPLQRRHPTQFRLLRLRRPARWSGAAKPGGEFARHSHHLHLQQHARSGCLPPCHQSRDTVSHLRCLLHTRSSGYAGLKL